MIFSCLGKKKLFILSHYIKQSICFPHEQFAPFENHGLMQKIRDGKDEYLGGQMLLLIVMRCGRLEKCSTRDSFPKSGQCSLAVFSRAALVKHMG
jgi:hypothetical protein